MGNRATIGIEQWASASPADSVDGRPRTAGNNRGRELPNRLRGPQDKAQLFANHMNEYTFKASGWGLKGKRGNGEETTMPVVLGSRAAADIGHRAITVVGRVLNRFRRPTDKARLFANCLNEYSFKASGWGLKGKRGNGEETIMPVVLGSRAAADIGQ